MSPIRVRLITIRIDGMVFNNFEAQTFIRPHGRLVIRLNNGHRIRIGDFDMRKATAPIEPDE